MSKHFFIILFIILLRFNSFCQTSDSLFIDAFPTVQSYIGGDDSLFSFLNSVKIPDCFLNDSIKGLILFEFSIATDGSVIDCKIIKSYIPQLDSLFYFKILQMPKWSSGTYSSKFTLPVKFNKYDIDNKKIREFIREIYSTKE